ncbi:MAG: hypothetical protein UH071_11625 [Paludibacteraceae bacterium]|nr:hypothetical protein [Paludibacteraceae bacterium]
MAENREETLMKKFVSALEGVFGIEIKEEVYKNIQPENFVSLKKALSNINNIVTLKVTNLFIEKLVNDDFIGEDQGCRMKADVNSTSANANGYDVEYTTDIRGEKNILAEVKCNIPVGDKHFGSAQKAGILKDIEGLLNGEEKSKSKANVGSYFKFMVFMDYEDEKHNHNVRDSVKSLLEDKYMNNVKWYSKEDVKGMKGCGLTTGNVYIILI